MLLTIYVTNINKLQSSFLLFNKDINNIFNVDIRIIVIMYNAKALTRVCPIDALR